MVPAHHSTNTVGWLHRSLWWLAPLTLTLLGATLRFVGLDHPHELVFDETYYVKDAWTLLNLGYESKWPDGSDERFIAGDASGYTTDGSYVVHPPLGKWVIALGLALFGPDSGWGWRFGTALAGTLLVPVLFIVARRVTGSLTWSSVASGLVALDPLAVAMSRVALLDGILALLVMVGFWLLIRDYDDARPRIAPAPSGWGRTVWARPWLLAAGVSFGAAAAVKWSGLYVLAGVGIGLVVVDAIVRRRGGVREWYLSAVLRQGPVTFLLLVPSAVVTYVLAWSGWLTTAGGWGRTSDANPFVALWNYHVGVYGFHVGLSSEHPYASSAIQWPPLLRPTAMWVDRPPVGEGDCFGQTDCMGVITSLPNPVVWWAGWLAIVAVAVFAVMHRSIRLAVPAAGVAVTWVPWLLYPERTIFHFYTIALLPFLVLALVLALQHLARTSRAAVGAFLVAAVAVAVFFLPLGLGVPLPHWLWWAHMWLPPWV